MHQNHITNVALLNQGNRGQNNRRLAANTARTVLSVLITSIVIASSLSFISFANAGNPNPNIPTSSSLNPFIDDSKLTGGLYFWSRERTRREPGESKYKTNLVHTASNLVLDYKSGYAADMFGIEIAGLGAVNISEASGSANPNEIALSKCRRWTDKFDDGDGCGGDRSGTKIFRAAGKFKSDLLWINAGYIQPAGQTLLSTNWSFTPGAYQGAELGTKLDFGSAGELQTSYMWVNQYMAPWHSKMGKFYQPDGKTRINYAHSIGLKYDFKNDLTFETAFGQTENFINQYLAKINYKFDFMGSPLTTSYGFYAGRDTVEKNTINNIYDGTAWKQALTFGYKIDDVSLRLEGTWIKAEGQKGNFGGNLFHHYGSGDGRGDIWWDNRSDFNANGEKAIFLGVNYALDKLELPGWNVGISGVYGWDAKPATWRLDNGIRVDDIDQSQRIKESAYSLSASYTIPEGRAKGTYFSLYYTQFFNNSDIPSWSEGFGNIFQDERDFKAMVIIPFTIF